MKDLKVVDVTAGYGKVTVLRGLTLTVSAGDAVALLGHNGAGKSTLLKALMGLVPVKSGTVRLGEKVITGAPSWERVRDGLALVPQGLGVFRDLTVAENIETGVFGVSRAHTDVFDAACQWFPALAPLRQRKAGLLSGGQRKMLAIAMAVVREPPVLMLDEPTIGLSPDMRERLFEMLREWQRSSGATLIVAEQNVDAALRWLDQAMVLKAGGVAWVGECADMRTAGPVAIANLL